MQGRSHARAQKQGQTLEQNSSAGAPSPDPLQHLKYRTDIDGLRAIAVLAVVGFHALPTRLTGGFVGVDIFFVISGYLISSIILQQVSVGRFSFLQFYSRRAKRIFPALIAVLVACYAFGWFQLLGDEFALLGKHMAAGAGFVSNLVLWSEAGYFDSAAEAKPLLHLWSLAVEEQFYLLWPFMIILAWRFRLKLPLMIASVIILSFVVSLVSVHSDASAAFYSPLTRFWELSIGSLLAYAGTSLPSPSQGRRWAQLHAVVSPPATAAGSLWLQNMMSVLGMVLLVAAITCLSNALLFPGWWALPPTLGAFLIIAAGPQAWPNRRILSNRVLVWFGLISYPLYLWHWPLLSFARLIEGEKPGLQVRLGAVALSVALAWLTYRLIERPIRFGKSHRAMAMGLFAALLAIGLIGWITFLRDGFEARAMSRLGAPVTQSLLLDAKIRARYPVGSCDKVAGLVGRAKNVCGSFNMDAPGPLLVVWGDSHSDAWAPVVFKIAADRLRPVIILNHPGCAPLLQVRRTDGIGNAAMCSEFGLAEDIVASLRNLRPGNVLLIARWSLYSHGNIKGGRLQSNTHFLTSSAEGRATVETSRQALGAQIPLTVRALSELTPSVMVFKSVPTLHENIRYGYIRHRDRFEPSLEEHRRLEAVNDNVLDQVALMPGVRVLDPARLFCNIGCKAVSDGTLLYVDDNHLSAQGAMRFEDVIGSGIR